MGKIFYIDGYALVTVFMSDYNAARAIEVAHTRLKTETNNAPYAFKAMNVTPNAHDVGYMFTITFVLLK